jgi:hypothetical protein
MTPIMDAEVAMAASADAADCTGDDPSWVEAIGTNHADRCMATEGCRNLLRAQLETGAHWIRDPDQLAAARASVGLSHDPI